MQATDDGAVLDTDEYGVVPSALSDDADVLVLNQPHVAFTDRQVCGVQGQFLAFAAFYGSASKKVCGVVKGVACTLLVGERDAVYISWSLLVPYL